MSENLQFKISSELKNIIGKDLIVNDEVAIFELVKNAYDAHATRVDITFEKDKIIIQDNGKGMDFNDIKSKWLFVAYSAKKDKSEDIDIEKNEDFKDYRDKINLRRGFAGAKGIGRFSCDRLGSKLKLISKKVSTKTFHELKINWDNFEQDAKNEFINIDITYTSPKNIENKDFSHGLILEITNLHSNWDDEKIDNLRKSLGKLINPFEVGTKSNNFQIYTKTGGQLFAEMVKNEIITVLTLKTTKIDTEIKNDKIITTLIDRGTLIYKIEEKNNYKHLKNTSTTLLFLNQKAKNNFTRTMNVEPVKFGHVFVFNNGFRVYPYGEIEDDSFGINSRHQQGYNRFLSTRNILGSIQLDEYSTHFKEKSSRDGGLIETEGYKELINFFWEKVLKRLEKYVVGIQWELESYLREQDRNNDTLSTLDRIESKVKIIELITKLSNSNDVKIVDFAGDFLNIIQEKNDSTDPAITNLINIAKKTNKKELLNELVNVQKNIAKISSEKNELEKKLYESSQREFQLLDENKEIKKQVKTVSKELETQTKRNIFQSSIIGMEKEQILGLQHQISHSSSRINRNIELLLKTLDLEKLTEKQKKYISVIRHETEKITSISKFVTKANFNLTASDIETDLIGFIRDYIEEVYLSKNKMIDYDINITNFKISNDVFVLKIKPLEITTLIDNFIQNSQKAKASQVIFNYTTNNNTLIITIRDNGIGIDEANIKNIFELGYTTTSGSGIGLFNIQTTIKNMKGKIEVKSTKNKETSFTIRLENAN